MEKAFSQVSSTTTQSAGAGPLPGALPLDAGPVGLAPCGKALPAQAGPHVRPDYILRLSTLMVSPSILPVMVTF